MWIRENSRTAQDFVLLLFQLLILPARWYGYGMRREMRSVSCGTGSPSSGKTITLTHSVWFLLRIISLVCDKWFEKHWPVSTEVCARSWLPHKLDFIHARHAFVHCWWCTKVREEMTWQLWMEVGVDFIYGERAVGWSFFFCLSCFVFCFLFFP